MTIPSLLEIVRAVSPVSVKPEYERFIFHTLFKHFLIGNCARGRQAVSAKPEYERFIFHTLYPLQLVRVRRVPQSVAQEIEQNDGDNHKQRGDQKPRHCGDGLEILHILE